MQISASQKLPLSFVSAGNIVENKKKPSQGNSSRIYNPVFYRTNLKTNIAFKGNNNGFEDFYPTDILGISEQKFDEMLLKNLENPNKRTALTEYIMSQAAKDNKTLGFVNLWKKQIPTIISYNFFGSMAQGSSTEIVRRATNVVSQKTVGSNLENLADSQHLNEIFKRDAKSLGAGGISLWLFKAGMVSPEPASKAGLLLASIGVGIVSQTFRSSDNKKISDKQFLLATKELIRAGIIDPLELTNKISPQKMILPEEKIKQYSKWQDNRLAYLRYVKTGSRKDMSSDFDTVEGKNVLKKSITALKDMGFDDDRVSEYLGALGLVYLSCGETKEAQFLLEIAVDSQEKLHGSNTPRILNALDTLAATQIENEEFLKARKTYQKALSIRTTMPESNALELFQTRKNILLLDNDIIKQTGIKWDVIQADMEASITVNRKSNLEKSRKNILKTREEINNEVANLTGYLSSQLLSGELDNLSDTEEFETSKELINIIDPANRGFLPIDNPDHLVKQLTEKALSTGSSANLPIKRTELYATDTYVNKVFRKKLTISEAQEVYKNAFGENSLSEAKLLEVYGKKIGRKYYVEQALKIKIANLGGKHPEVIGTKFILGMLSENNSEISRIIAETKASDHPDKASYVAQLYLRKGQLEVKRSKEYVDPNKLFGSIFDGWFSNTYKRHSKGTYYEIVDNFKEGLKAPNEVSLKAMTSLINFIEKYKEHDDTTYCARGPGHTYTEFGIGYLTDTVNSYPGKYKINQRRLLKKQLLDLEGAWFDGGKREKIRARLENLERQTDIEKLK